MNLKFSVPESLAVGFLAGLLGAPFAALWGTCAWAQKVSKTIPDKGFVLSSFEDTASIKVGQFACFLDGSETTVACGKIVKVTATVVVVKTTPLSTAAQVKPGFKMTVSDSQPPGLLGAGAAESKGNAGTKLGKKKAGGSSLRLLTSPGLGAFSVAKIGYLPPPLGASGVKLWEATDSLISVEKMSGAIEYESRKLGTFGLRFALCGDSEFKFASKLSLQTDYDPTNRQVYVEASHSVTAFGAYYDYTLKRPAAGASGLRLTTGLDFVSSTATVEADWHNEADVSRASLATIKSQLSVVSLRGGADYILSLGKLFELGIGLRALLPMAEFGLKQTTTVNDDNASKSIDEQQDLKDALSHKKTAFGLLIPVYASMNF